MQLSALIPGAHHLVPVHVALLLTLRLTCALGSREFVLVHAQNPSALHPNHTKVNVCNPMHLSALLPGALLPGASSPSALCSHPHTKGVHYDLESLS